MILKRCSFGPTRQSGIWLGKKCKIEFLHDFSGGKTEGLFVKQLPDGNVIAGLADTHKEVYSPSHPAVLPHGDQIVAQAFGEAIFSATDETTTSIALRANKILRAKLEAINRNRSGKLPLIDLDDAARVPGAAIIIVKTDIVAREVEMFQTCDVGSIYEWSCGYQITPYRNWQVEQYHQEKIQSLLVQTCGDKGIMWDEFFGFLSESRRAVNNKSEEVVILNGTAAFEDFASNQVIDGDLYCKIMLFSDGALPDNEAFPGQRQKLLYRYLCNPDLNLFLLANRVLQRELVDKSHVYGGIPEASLVELTVRR